MQHFCSSHQPRSFVKIPRLPFSHVDMEHPNPSYRSCKAGLRWKDVPVAKHTGLTAGM